MAVIRSVVRILGWGAVLVAPLLVHVALATGRHVVLALILAAIQLSVGVMLALRRWRWAWIWLAAGLALAGGLAWRIPHDVLALQSGLSHSFVYGGLLVLFGCSLLPGRRPLITAIAIRLSGRITPERAAYTRRVTQAWCVFCIAQLTASAVLLATAPLEIWSLFVNVLDFPFLCLMFAGEYAIRRRRFRHQPHASLRDGIRAFASRDPHAG